MTMTDAKPPTTATQPSSTTPTTTLGVTAKVGPRVASRTAAGWENLPYTRFEVQPLTPTIGAVITGISMADALDEAQ